MLKWPDMVFGPEDPVVLAPLNMEAQMKQNVEESLFIYIKYNDVESFPLVMMIGCFY